MKKERETETEKERTNEGKKERTQKLYKSLVMFRAVTILKPFLSCSKTVLTIYYTGVDGGWGG